MFNSDEQGIAEDQNGPRVKQRGKVSTCVNVYCVYCCFICHRALVGYFGGFVMIKKCPETAISDFTFLDEFGEKLKKYKCLKTRDSAVLPMSMMYRLELLKHVSRNSRVNVKYMFIQNIYPFLQW
jgi:hypothetical protein